MRVTSIKYNEPGVSKFLMALAENFAQDNFVYVKEFKKHLKLGPKDSVDVIVLLEDDKKITHLYDGLNYKLGFNAKVPTFFRGKDGKSLMFPGGFNILFVNINQFRALHHRWHIIAAVVEKDLISIIRGRIIDGYKESMLLVLDHNSYFNEDKEVIELFAAKPAKKDLREYL